jgi:hypothetical protein
MTPPLCLPESLRAFGSDAFSAVLRGELERAGVRVLGLERGTTQGGQIPEDTVQVSLIRASGEDSTIRARVGVFFTEAVGGCSCGDDPYESKGYMELTITIDRATAMARVEPLAQGEPE